MLLHGWDTGPGLGTIEPQSTCAVDVLDELREEHYPAGLILFDGMVALTSQDRDELRSGLEEGAALAG